MREGEIGVVGLRRGVATVRRRQQFPKARDLGGVTRRAGQLAHERFDAPGIRAGRQFGVQPVKHGTQAGARALVVAIHEQGGEVQRQRIVAVADK